MKRALALLALLACAPLYAQTSTISALPAGSTILGPEALPMDQTGCAVPATCKTTPSALLSYFDLNAAIGGSQITSGTISAARLPNTYVIEPLLSNSATVYVTTVGNDSNDCLTWQTACATINGAWSVVSGGSNCSLYGGTVEVGQGSFAGFSIAGCTYAVTISWTGTTSTITCSAGTPVGGFLAGTGITAGTYVTANTTGTCMLSQATTASSSGSYTTTTTSPVVRIRGRGLGLNPSTTDTTLPTGHQLTTINTPASIIRPQPGSGGGDNESIEFRAIVEDMAFEGITTGDALTIQSPYTLLRRLSVSGNTYNGINVPQHSGSDASWMFWADNVIANGNTGWGLIGGLQAAHIVNSQFDHNGNGFTATLTGTSGTNQVTVSSATGVVVGDVIIGASPFTKGSNYTVTAISGTTLTLNTTWTGTLSGSYTFYAGNISLVSGTEELTIEDTLIQRTAGFGLLTYAQMLNLKGDHFESDNTANLNPNVCASQVCVISGVANFIGNFFYGNGECDYASNLGSGTAVVNFWGNYSYSHLVATLNIANGWRGGTSFGNATGTDPLLISGFLTSIPTVSSGALWQSTSTSSNNEPVGNSPVWVRAATFFASSFSTAGTTNTITLYTLPAGAIIHGVRIYPAQAFTGTSITAYTVSVGLSGTVNKYANATSVFTTGATVFQDSYPATGLNVPAAVAGAESMTGTTTITATATSTGANLNAATTGEVVIWLQLSIPGP